jgi:undecaprenyl-diphosphatase
MDISDAIVLGLVQGVTEFLPISSTGHLVIVRDLLTVDPTHMLAFDAVLHFATTIAVILYFWNDIWTLIQALLRKLGRLPVNQKDLDVVYALAIATVPAVVAGLLLESHFEQFQTPTVVAGFLAIGAIFFLYTEWRYYLRPDHGSITLSRAWKIGLFQAAALFPGISRSGATIASGMLFGMTRYEASRFSFLLAIPITLGVGIKKSLDLISLHEAFSWTPLVIGALTAAVTAFVVIHFFLQFIRKYTLWPFIWYSFALSGLVGYVSFIS